MKTYTINVTKKDIAEGEMSNGDFCPVALALNRKNLPFTVCVTQQSLDFYDYLKTPTIVKRFIKNFDGGRKVKPFKFKLFLALDGD